MDPALRGSLSRGDALPPPAPRSSPREEGWEWGIRPEHHPDFGGRDPQITFAPDVATHRPDRE
eukprot:13108605-Heterocapsa_arctica.AAC.1